MRAIQRESSFAGDCRALIREPLGPADVAGEDSDHCSMPEGVGERVSVAELARMAKRSIGGSRRLVGIAVMPECPGQIGQCHRTDVLAIAESEFAMLLGPIE